MFYDINELLKKPEIYKETAVAFWDDEHISKEMLKAHLNPEFEGASRKLEFIDNSVAWIKQIVPSSENPLLLDVGCGPGIYAERFTKAGFSVTGVDFSKRSIEYAKSSAIKQKLDVTYIYQNYLELNLDKTFDFATMIYCDYGALSTSNRQLIMQKIYDHLKPGGKFLLDVFSMENYRAFEEKQTWEACPNGGFWREKEYVVLNGFYQYSGNVTLEQITIISDDETAVYYLWNCCFTPETLIKEAVDTGFKVCNVFGDVAGSPYSEESLTIALLLEK